MPALALIALATIAAPEELGVVDWRHGFDAAVKTARQAERPILLLFQEVPG